MLGSTDFRVIALGADLREIEFAPLSEHRDIIFIIDCSHDIRIALEQVGRLKAEFPGSHVVLLAEHSSLEGIISAFQAGVNGYLANVHSGDAFVKALELVMLGETVLPAELLDYVKRAGNFMPCRPERMAKIKQSIQTISTPNRGCRSEKNIFCDALLMALRTSKSLAG